MAAKKNPDNCDLIRAQIQEAKTKVAAEKARLKKEKDEAIKQARAEIEQKKEARKVAKEAAAKAKKEAAGKKAESVTAKRKEAQALRAKKLELKAQQQKAAQQAKTDTQFRKELLEEDRKAAKKKADEEKAAAKKQNKEDLAAAKKLKKDTEAARKEQLKLDKAKAKEAADALDADKQRVRERRERNAKIKENVKKYQQELAAKITPQKQAQIDELVGIIKNTQGIPRKEAMYTLGKTLAEIKGVELLPGQDPWSTVWAANVLFSVSTNVSNIVGNVAAPVRQVISDIALGKFSKAGRFTRGYLKAIVSLRTLKDTWSGLKGELGAREDVANAEGVNAEQKNEASLEQLATGVKVLHEHDPIRGIQSKFGTGKLGKLLSWPGMSLRVLGAMDAVFSRAAQEGRVARETPSYSEYLDAKAADYAKYSAQAKNEQARMEKAGVPIPYNFVNRRADELSFAAKPAEMRERIKEATRRDVFQSEKGPRGLAGRFLAKTLNLANTDALALSRTKELNTAWTIASALNRANRTLRNDMGVDQVYPLVVRGVTQGQTLVINGKDVKSGTTEQVLGEIVDAITNKQVIALRGDSIKPFKYTVGMFVRTSSQLLDMSMEALPGIGYFDKMLGNRVKLDGKYAAKWNEYDQDQRNQLHGTQLAALALTAGVLAKLVPNMDDEEKSSVYIYGGMRDAKLKEYYKAKGIQPFTFRVGNTTISYKDIPGINLLLGGFGELSDSYMVAKRTPDRPLDTVNALGMAGLGSLYAATQVSLMKNLTVISDLLATQELQNAKPDLLNNQYLRGLADIMSNMTSGVVPFAGAGRELERMVYGDLSRPKDIPNRVLQNIPFAKFVSDNEPALNIFGEPLRAHIWPGISRFVGTAEKSYEIDWLLRNGYTVSLPKPGTRLTKKQQEKYASALGSEDPEVFEDFLTQEDQRSYMQIVGPGLKAILGDFADRDPYGYDPDIQKRLDKEVKKMKSAAKDAILRGE